VTFNEGWIIRQVIGQSFDCSHEAGKFKRRGPTGRQHWNSRAGCCAGIPASLGLLHYLVNALLSCGCASAGHPVIDRDSRIES
jgi:hypothetical protein